MRTIRERAQRDLRRAENPTWTRAEDRRILGNDLGGGRGQEIVARDVHPDNAPLIEDAPDFARFVLRVTGPEMRERIRQVILGRLRTVDPEMYQSVELVYGRSAGGQLADAIVSLLTEGEGPALDGEPQS